MHNRIRLFLCALFLTSALLLQGLLPALCEEQPYAISSESCPYFQDLLLSLSAVCDSPTEEALAHIRETVEKISAVSNRDGFLAESIASNWIHLFVNPDGTYTDHLFVWDRSRPGTAALELKETPLSDCSSHAFIVLGYQLSDGEMTEELMGRCEAAAAAARAFPDSILVCTGGVTGGNNPERHSEAGRMKEYLVTVCGLEPSRIFTDENAMTTIDNAVNSLAILREQRIRTFTVVTSDYHQKWGQVLCSAQAALEEIRYGCSIRPVENYSYQTHSRTDSVREARTAMSQLTSLLKRNGYTPPVPTPSPLPSDTP